MVTDAFNIPPRVIVRGIEDDAWLCRRLLAAVNTGLFRPPRPVHSIKEAVTLFGLTTVVHLSDRIRSRRARAGLLGGPTRQRHTPPDPFGSWADDAA